MRLLIIIAMSFCILNVHATSSVRFRKISIGGGLTQNTVTTLMQDEYGCLWIGSQDGLNMYNGSSFRHFKHNSNDTNSLSDNFILDLYQDANGQIWVATRNGLNLLNRNTFQFKRYYGPSETRRKYHNMFFRLAPVGPDFIISQHNGFVLGHTATFTFYSLKKIIHQSLQNIKLQDLFPTQDGFMIATNRGLLVFKYNHGFQFIHIPLMQGEIIKSAMKWNDETEIWVGTTHSLYSAKIENGNHTISAIWEHDAERQITCMEEADSATCWIGTHNGLFITNRYTPGYSACILPDIRQREGISSGDINTLLLGDNGCIWVGTINAGLNIYDPQTDRFRFIEIASNENTSRINAAWGLFQTDEKTIIAGNYEGMQIIRFNKPIKEIASSNTTYWTYETEPFEAKKINQRVTYIHGDSLYYWLATSGNGLFRYDIKSKEIVQYLHHPQRPSISSNTIYHISPTRDGALWLSTQDGLTLFNPALNTFETIKTSSYSPELNDFVLYTYVSFNKKLQFICTANGLIVEDKEQHTRKIYQHNDTIPESISFNITTSVCEDKRGYFWVATLGGGINRLDASTGTFEHFGQAEGLLDEVVYTVVPDEAGNIWFSSNTATGKINSATLDVRVYPINEIFTQVEFSQNSYHLSNEGTLFFGGSRGIVFFDPSQFKNKEKPEKVLLNDLRLNFRGLRPSDSIYVIGSPLLPQRIIMKPGIHSLYTEFAAIDYRNQSNIQFAYMLEGHDEQWIELPTGQYSVLYSGLQFGDYILKVKYRLKGESWFPLSLQIPISIIPPFYQTQWFSIGISLFLIISSGLLIRYLSTLRLKRKLRQIETQAKVQEERARISRELHDNIGSQLTYVISSLDKINYRLTPENTFDEKEKLEALGVFARKTMKELRETIHTLDKKSYNLIELVQKIKELTTTYATHIGIETEITQSIKKSCTIEPIIFIHLYRIVQESLQNILKYAQATKISVDISYQRKKISIRIQDNGIGFDTTAQSKGNGLRNMQQRVQEIDGNWEIESNPQMGTTILIKVPVRNNT